MSAFPLHHQDFSEADTVDMDALSVAHKTVSAPESAKNMVLEIWRWRCTSTLPPPNSYKYAWPAHGPPGFRPSEADMRSPGRVPRICSRAYAKRCRSRSRLSTIRSTILFCPELPKYLSRCSHLQVVSSSWTTSILMGSPFLFWPMSFPSTSFSLPVSSASPSLSELSLAFESLSSSTPRPRF